MIFEEVTFCKSELPAGTSILAIRYNYTGSQNNNLFYLIDNQLDYVLAYYFAELKTMKRNLVMFFTNLLIKPIIKKISYCNTNKLIDKFSTLLWQISDNK